MQEEHLFELGEEKIFSCPVFGMDRDLINEAFALSNGYANGYLPYGGGLYDQPNRLLSMIEIVNAAKSKAST